MYVNMNWWSSGGCIACSLRLTYLFEHIGLFVLWVNVKYITNCVCVGESVWCLSSLDFCLYIFMGELDSVLSGVLY